MGVFMKFLDEQLNEIEVEEKYIQEIIETSKNYYVHASIDDSSTDFNDRYSSSHSFDIEIQQENIIVKNNKFFGVKVTARGDYGDKKTRALTIDNKIVDVFIGSVYANTSSSFTLRKYEK